MIIRRPPPPPANAQLSIKNTFQAHAASHVGLPEVPSGELREMAGHFTRLEVGATTAQTISTIDSDKAFSAWKGLILYKRWNFFETAKGIYNFDYIDDVVAALVAATDAGHIGGRKFGFRIRTREFQTTDPAVVVPQYLVNEELTFVGQASPSNPRAGAALWKKVGGVFKCMDYFIALHKAVLDHVHPTLGKLRDLPNFVIMYGEESNYGLSATEQAQVGYDRQVCIDSEIYRAEQLLAYEPRIGWSWLTNGVTRDTSLRSFLRQWFSRAAATPGIYYSTGPDVNQNPPSRSVLLGLQAGGSPDVDYRNVPGNPVLNIMERTWTDSPDVQTAADIYPRLAQNNAQAIVWTRQNSTGTAAQQWVTGIRPYISENPTWSAQPLPVTYDFDAGAVGSYTYIDKSSYVRGGASALSITAPASRQAGDLLLLYAASQAAAEEFNSPPTGWTQLHASGGGGTRKIALVARIATANSSDDVTHDFWTGTGNNSAQMAVFRPSGTVPSLASIVHASSNFGPGTGLGLPTPARSIGINGTLILGMVRKNKNVTEDECVLTSPSWMTDVITEHVQPGDFVEIYAWGYTHQSEAADIPADQWSQSIDNSSARRGVVVALVAPPPGGPAIVSSSGKGTTSVTDGSAMGGTYLRYNANAVNDFITFEFAVPAWATYKIKIKRRTASDFGRVQLAIDGANFGAVEDFFVSGDDWYPGDRHLTAGLHQFKFTIVGKNAGSSDFRIGLDYITLEP